MGAWSPWAAPAGEGRNCKGAHIGCERKGPAQGSRKDRMERVVWSGVPFPG